MQIRTYKRRIEMLNEMISEADTDEKIQAVSDMIAKLNKAFISDYSTAQAQIIKLQKELKEWSEPINQKLGALERKLSKAQKVEHQLNSDTIISIDAATGQGVIMQRINPICTNEPQKAVVSQPVIKYVGDIKKLK